MNWEVVSEQKDNTEPNKEWQISVTPPRQARYVRIDKIEAVKADGPYEADFITELRIFGSALVTVEKEYDGAGLLVRRFGQGLESEI